MKAAGKETIMMWQQQQQQLNDSNNTFWLFWYEVWVFKRIEFSQHYISKKIYCFCIFALDTHTHTHLHSYPGSDITLTSLHCEQPDQSLIPKFNLTLKWKFDSKQLHLHHDFSLMSTVIHLDPEEEGNSRHLGWMNVGLVGTGIPPQQQYGGIFIFFPLFFICWRIGHQLRDLYWIWLKRCLPLKPQKCSVDSNTSPTPS